MSAHQTADPDNTHVEIRVAKRIDPDAARELWRLVFSLQPPDQAPASDVEPRQ
jgi:hypothetical protein